MNNLEIGTTYKRYKKVEKIQKEEIIKPEQILDLNEINNNIIHLISKVQTEYDSKPEKNLGDLLVSLNQSKSILKKIL